MRYWLGRLFLAMLGFRVEGKHPEHKKYVIVAAPHTSNWDFPVMLGVAWVIGLNLSTFVKHTMFWWPMGLLMHRVGAIPVDRGSSHNMVAQAVDSFRNREELELALAPEGTRSKTGYWKTGFYWIAFQAQVPIVLGFLDYGRRVGGVGPTLMPSGDIHADFEKIREFYKDIKGKNPSLHGEIRLKEPAPDQVDQLAASA